MRPTPTKPTPPRSSAAFSLVELLVVMAIIAIVATALVTVSNTVRTRAQVRTTQATIQLLDSALTAYQQDRDTGRGNFEFPTEPFLEAELDDANPEDAHLIDYFYACWPYLGTADFALGAHMTFTWDDEDDLPLPPAEINDEKNQRIAARASIEFLYWMLNDIKASRVILEKLPANTTANEDDDSVTVDIREVTLVEVNDAWGRPIRYRTQGTGNFPLLTSAGPDGIFDNADDIVSSEL